MKQSITHVGELPIGSFVIIDGLLMRVTKRTPQRTYFNPNPRTDGYPEIWQGKVELARHFVIGVRRSYAAEPFQPNDTMLNRRIVPGDEERVVNILTVPGKTWAEAMQNIVKHEPVMEAAYARVEAAERALRDARVDRHATALTVFPPTIEE